jgi:uncharacterized protein YjbI with pentapeptide repeats
MTQEELEKILTEHAQWRKGIAGPRNNYRRADLRRKDLRGLDLRGLELASVKLVGADLREARLTDDQLELPGVAEALLESWAKGDAEL